jgi:hypothetical protein
MAYGGTAQDYMIQFSLLIYYSIEDFELVKSLEGFRPLALPSKFMTVLLNFQFIPRYLCRKSIMYFRLEILLIDSSNGP